MRHELLHIDHPVLHQSYRPRPCVAVPILELEIDFLRAETHERNTHVGFSDTNDEDFPAEFNAVDGVGDGGFDARAFERDGGFDAVCGGDDFVGAVRWLQGGVDFVGFCARAQFGGVLEAAFVDVGDDDGAGAGGLAAEEGDEADGAGAADEDAVAEGDAGAFHACEGDAEGFEEGAVFVGHGADFVAPDGRVVDVAAEEAVDGWGGEEFHVLAAVVAACEALFAVVADQAGFDGDAIAGLEVCDGGMSCEDDTSGFVAEDVVIGDDHGANGTGMPEVDVRSERSYQSLRLSAILFRGMGTRRCRCS